MPWRRGNINGLSILWQLGLDETLRKIDAYCESVYEIALVFLHVLPLHDQAHLKPLNLLCVLSRRVSLDLIMEAGGDGHRTHGSSLRLIFFKHPRANMPVISLPCSSF
jgi:hypothetical protein